MNDHAHPSAEGVKLPAVLALDDDRRIATRAAKPRAVRAGRSVPR